MAIENAHRNRRTWIENRSNCNYHPIGGKWQSKTLFLIMFYLRSSIVLTFLIATFPVWLCLHKNGTKTLMAVELKCKPLIKPSNLQTPGAETWKNGSCPIKDKCFLLKDQQRSDAGEARTRDPSVSSQALYHWASAIPIGSLTFIIRIKTKSMRG